MDSCGFCRKQFEDIQESLRLSSEVQMPEPSPLFWDHLSGRVRNGIAETSAGERSWNLWRGPQAPRFISTALGIAAVLIVVAAGWYLRPAATLESPGEESRADAGGTAIALDPSTSEAWETVRAAAERVNWEDAEAAGLGARPESVERAILDLDDRERQQLLSLLEQELERVERRKS